MKKITLDVKNHTDRMTIMDILASNGYYSKLEVKTECEPTKYCIVTYVPDSEVEE